MEAFIFSFDQDADYDGVNFQWFRDRHPAGPALPGELTLYDRSSPGCGVLR